MARLQSSPVSFVLPTTWSTTAVRQLGKLRSRRYFTRLLRSFAGTHRLLLLQHDAYELTCMFLEESAAVHCCLRWCVLLYLPARRTGREAADSKSVGRVHPSKRRCHRVHAQWLPVRHKVWSCHVRTQKPGGTGWLAAGRHHEASLAVRTCPRDPAAALPELRVGDAVAAPAVCLPKDTRLCTASRNPQMIRIWGEIRAPFGCPYRSRMLKSETVKQ